VGIKRVDGRPIFLRKEKLSQAQSVAEFCGMMKLVHVARWCRVDKWGQRPFMELYLRDLGLNRILLKRQRLLALPGGCFIEICAHLYQLFAVRGRFCAVAPERLRG